MQHFRASAPDNSQIAVVPPPKHRPTGLARRASSEKLRSYSYRTIFCDSDRDSLLSFRSGRTSTIVSLFAGGLARGPILNPPRDWGVPMVRGRQGQAQMNTNPIPQFSPQFGFQTMHSPEALLHTQLQQAFWAGFQAAQQLQQLANQAAMPTQNPGFASPFPQVSAASTPWHGQNWNFQVPTQPGQSPVHGFAAPSGFAWASSFGTKDAA